MNKPENSRTGNRRRSVPARRGTGSGTATNDGREGNAVKKMLGKKGAVPSTVEDVLEYGLVAKNFEVDVLVEMFEKLLYIRECEAVDNVMEWTDIDFKTGETYVGLEMEWSDVDLKSGEAYVRLEMEWSDVDLKCGEAYVVPEMERSSVEIETGETSVRKNICEGNGGQKRKRVNRRR